MGTALACVLLSVCFIIVSLDLMRVKKYIKDLRSEFDNLSDFSLKHIQDHNHE